MPTTSTLQASVIIPAYNAAETLQDCLSALSQQDIASESFEVIVVDDGSTDDTAIIARASGATVIVQGNAGPAAARNRGAEVARGPLLLFTDSDCAPTPGWVRELTSAFSDPSVSGAKGTYLTAQRGAIPRFTQVEYEERYRRMRDRPTIDFIDTYSAAYRRDVFLANGGFDTIFSTPSVEDQELSFRLASKGYRLVFVPSAQVFHLHNATLHAYIRRKYLIGYWKALLARWHPGRMVTDSHTPQTLKLQMVLGVLTFAALASWPLLSWALPQRAWLCPLAAGIAVSLFALSSIPFLLRISRADPALLPISAVMLWVRALALTAGLGVGLLQLRRTAAKRHPIAWWQRVIKRSLDLILSVLGLLVASVPMIIIALCIKLSSPGPIVFRQSRVGQDGNIFTIYKFRSMVPDAEHLLPTLIALDHLPSPAFKIRHDPRVTPIGRLLRRYSLDELPQLFNVLFGDMSIVGPRPEEARLVSLYNDAQRRRLAVKPGVTGPMQVNGRGDLPFDARLSLELDYIDHYSLRRDLSILLRTLPVVLFGKGAY